MVAKNAAEKKVTVTRASVGDFFVPDSRGVLNRIEEVILKGGSVAFLIVAVVKLLTVEFSQVKHLF